MPPDIPPPGDTYANQRQDYLDRQSQQYGVIQHTNKWSRISLALRIALWLVLWGFFVEVEFGLVYFVLSMFYWIYFSLSTRSPGDQAPSAYSVFNPNCETISGTFTAEQFEKQLRHGRM